MRRHCGHSTCLLLASLAALVVINEFRPVGFVHCSLRAFSGRLGRLPRRSAVASNQCGTAEAHFDQAALYRRMSELHRELWRPYRALKQLRASLLMLQEHGARGSTEAATTLYQTALVQMDLDRFDDALMSLAEAQRVLEVEGLKSTTLYARILIDRAVVCAGFDNFQGGADALAKVHGIPMDADMSAKFEEAHGLLKVTIGDFTGALQHYRRARTILELEAPHSSKRMSICSHIFNVLEECGQYEDAIEELQPLLDAMDADDVLETQEGRKALVLEVFHLSWNESPRIFSDAVNEGIASRHMFEQWSRVYVKAFNIISKNSLPNMLLPPSYSKQSFFAHVARGYVLAVKRLEKHALLESMTDMLDTMKCRQLKRAIVKQYILATFDHIDVMKRQVLGFDSRVELRKLTMLLNKYQLQDMLAGIYLDSFSRLGRKLRARLLR